MGRAVARGLLRRKRCKVTRIGVDETSFRRRHEYVTIVTDLKSSRVLHVADDRNRESLDVFFRSLTYAQVEAIEVVAMDMYDPYILSVSDHLSEADRKIAFDKWHVAKNLGEAVDRVRRQEHKTLLSQGDRSLKRTRYLWLTRADNLDAEQTITLNALHKMNLKRIGSPSGLRTFRSHRRDGRMGTAHAARACASMLGSGDSQSRYALRTHRLLR
jgi:transposase